MKKDLREYEYFINIDTGKLMYRSINFKLIQLSPIECQCKLAKADNHEFGIYLR